MRKLIQELQVHQIELEIQNQNLRQSQEELEVARDRYFDLYDLAPVGYCTINEKGQIIEANLAAAEKSRDMAREETESARKELGDLKGSLAENQGSADTILSELQKVKADLAAAQAALEAFKGEAQTTKDKLAAPTTQGALVPITPEILPARPINLSRITPKARKASGVVVVNVLVSEAGEVLGTRLLQGLPGEGEWVDKANAACVEAAKRIVFDPARTADGKTKVRVWQGVGFLLD